MWENTNTNLSLLLRNHSIIYWIVTKLHNFQTNGVFKISSYGNLITKFMCLISARNNNSPRIVSVKVLILPVAAEPTLHAIKHL